MLKRDDPVHYMRQDWAFSQHHFHSCSNFSPLLGYSRNPNSETLPLPALRQSAAVTSLTQPPARHPLRLTGGLSSEETNSTNSARHPLRTADPTPAKSPVSRCAQSNSPFQRRRPRLVALLL
ncbi:hypothetical protein AHAS_Ahas05G0151400 [Arachis hypogaea]